MQEEISGCSC